MVGYETVFITHPDLEDDTLKNILKKFKDLIKKTKGKVFQEHLWGRRRMAYSIANQNYGVYHIWYLEGSGAMLDELHTQFRYSDEVIRFQTIKVEDLEQESSLFNEMLKTQEEEAAARTASIKTPASATKGEEKTEAGVTPEKVAEKETQRETAPSEQEPENNTQIEESKKTETSETEKTES